MPDATEYAFNPTKLTDKLSKRGFMEYVWLKQ